MKSNVDGLLRMLRADKTIWAEAECGHSYRLATSELFYGDDFTARAVEFLSRQKQAIADLRQQVRNLHHKLTAGFTKKSVEIKLGKTVEKVCPLLPGFPYNPLDCRGLFDPIDYLAFIGASEGSVRRIEFVDLKTGNASLTKIQRQVRDAVEDGKVSVGRLGQ